MISWPTSFPTTRSRPPLPDSRPAAPCRAAPSAPVEYTEIDCDFDLDPVVRTLAGAIAHNASRELGLPKAPPIRFFQTMTPVLKAYRARYLRGLTLKTWSDHRDLLGVSDTIRAGGAIWLRADLRGDDLAETVRHEVFHHWEHRFGTDYGEETAEAFARGELELEAA